MMPGTRQRRASPPALQTAHVPAPLGGINRVDPASAMPATDALFQYNMYAGELGLSARPGWVEWVKEIDSPCRCQIPYTGSAQNGSQNRLFQASVEGIWNATASTDTPSLSLTFTSQINDAGRGISTAYSTLGGRWCLYADEENGLHIYKEATDTWTKAVFGGAPWQATTAYVIGNRVTNAGNVYVCDTNGTSAGVGGPTGTGTNIVDGTTRWDYVAAADFAIGASAADQANGFIVDPADFAFIMVFKNRLWAVEKDTTAAWYSGVGEIFGAWTRFDFGMQFKAGGDLRGLWNWTYDGGAGLDDRLVGLSGAGDCVVYAGTDPDTVETFGLVGVWYVGALPAGRRVATDFGGEMMALSVLGLIPLSKLVAGTAIQDASLYATRKMQPLFNALSRQFRTVQGWSVVVHPTTSCLLITVPEVADTAVRIFAMSFTEGGWGEWRGLPMTAACVWDGNLYFGTADGQVCINTGNVDAVLLDSPDDYIDIDYSILFAYRNLGNAQQKQVMLVEPIIISDTPSPTYEGWAKYDFDLSEPPAPGATSAAAGSIAVFDSAIFDESVFGGDGVASQSYFNGAGYGKHVALAVRGKANTKTTLVGVNVAFIQGGYV